MSQRWFGEPPKSCGYYWLLEEGAREAPIVRIYGAAGHRMTMAFGCSLARPLSEYDRQDALWCGPIPYPGEPE